jgi:hypothetical protein
MKFYFYKKFGDANRKNYVPPSREKMEEIFKERASTNFYHTVVVVNCVVDPDHFGNPDPHQVKIRFWIRIQFGIK